MADSIARLARRLGNAQQAATSGSRTAAAELAQIKRDLHNHPSTRRAAATVAKGGHTVKR